MTDKTHPEVTVFDNSNTVTSVVRDPQTNKVAIIDSVLSFNYASGRTNTCSAGGSFVLSAKINMKLILETMLTQITSPQRLISSVNSEGKSQSVNIFENPGVGNVFNEGELFLRDGSQFDHLFKDGERFMIGEMEVKVLYTPGHTPACVSYYAGDALFVGDTLFMPDFGTARCDFPGGSAETLYASVQRLLNLPSDTRMFVGHDYKTTHRDHYAWETTVGDQRAHNIHLGEGKGMTELVELGAT